MWELVLSLHWLGRGRHGPQVPGDVARWRSDTVTGLAGRPLGRRVHDHLMPLAPASSYWPDFLTPHTGAAGLEPALDTLLSTSRARIGRELARLTTRSGEPSWGADLGTGRPDALRVLSDGMRSYFGAALVPRWSDIGAQVATEHTRLMGAVASGGIEDALASLRPVAAWHPADRVLEARYPLRLDVRLGGRGLRLIPSWFCSTTPVVLADPALPPVLVLPLAHRPPPPADPDALARLLGPARARILAVITVATPTATIRRETGISASQLSRHAGVLRANNLIVQAVHAGRTFYTRTALGDALAVPSAGPDRAFS
ncbi:transcriptional regulator [Actinomadura cremea]|nr:transcriptional regulator [Actinomadura cremea]